MRQPPDPHVCLELEIGESGDTRIRYHKGISKAEVLDLLSQSKLMAEITPSSLPDGDSDGNREITGHVRWGLPGSRG